tara:strand:- start:1939 stop:2772 length:834 start_codon:yes stop_codon:yes gene_type:complete
MNNILQNYIDLLKQKNFENPYLELRAIINNINKTKSDIILSNFSSKNIDFELFEKYFYRRLKNEPFSKIVNKKNFWKYSFYVNQNVLDPRPETELIIESVQNYFKNKNQNLKILDIGTGTGCLAISLAKEYKNSSVVATDISKKALGVANYNSKKYNTVNQITFKLSKWINSNEIFDVVVSNPPYLSEAEFRNLPECVKKYEPRISLFGGKDGLKCYKEIASKLTKIINVHSICFIEIGYRQKDKCIEIFKKSGLKCAEIIPDYQNYDRILVLKLKK